MFKRYRTALSRHHRSRGFGIHSPFAFDFVRGVLRERLPYYCYPQLETLRRNIVERTTGRWHRNNIISLKDAKVLFRVVNHFNPSHIMQVGCHHGMASATMLAVSATSTLTLHEPNAEAMPVTASVLAPFGERVTRCDSMATTISHYQSLTTDSIPLVLVEDLASEADRDLLKQYLTAITQNQAVVVLRNIGRNKLIRQLWRDLKHSTPMGQTYTNEKLAIINATPRLQREDFLLWI